MRAGLTIGAYLFLATSLTPATADERGSMDAGIVRPDKIEWADGPKSLPPGAKLATLEGDITKEGPFVVRLKLPDGYTVPPHTHPKTERLTVLSGTFNIMMVDVDKELPRRMPAGSFGYWAAGMSTRYGPKAKRSCNFTASDRGRSTT